MCVCVNTYRHCYLLLAGGGREEVLLTPGLPEDKQRGQLMIGWTQNFWETIDSASVRANVTFPPKYGQNSPLTGSSSCSPGGGGGAAKSDLLEWLAYSISSCRFVLVFSARLKGSRCDLEEAEQPGKINLQRDSALNHSSGSWSRTQL